MKNGLKVKKGDLVLVMKGKDRGKKQKVLRVFPRTLKVLVEGVNEKTRHVQPRRAGQKGERVRVASPIPSANVMAVCPHCGKGTRVGCNDNARVCKKCKGTL